jgi:hypothetical protein
MLYFQIFQNLLLGLEIVVGTVLLLNKIFVFFKRPIGWVFGMMGMPLAVTYLYFNMTRVNWGSIDMMIISHITLFVLMTYGYMIYSKETDERIRRVLKRWDRIFKVVVVSITIIVTYNLLLDGISKNFVLIQFMVGATGLVGTLLLAFNTNIFNIFGWLFYVLCHSISTVLMYQTDSDFIAIGQALSALVAFAGLIQQIVKIVKKKTKVPFPASSL